MSEDSDPKWNEPATRDDFRNLSIRLDTRFELLLEQFKLKMSYGLLIFLYATIMINLAFLWIFATLVK